MENTSTSSLHETLPVETNIQPDLLQEIPGELHLAPREVAISKDKLCVTYTKCDVNLLQQPLVSIIANIYTRYQNIKHIS